LDRRTRNSCRGDVDYLRVGLKGTHPSKEKWIDKDKVRGLFLTYFLIDERFWWSKNLSVGRRDPKRIQISLRTNQNLQRQLRALIMGSTDRKKRNFYNGTNGSSNRVTD
jgi:hypothetical protein